MCIFEGVVLCIGNFYSLLNLDENIGDGLVRIIWCNHGVGGILHLTGSDGYILIV